MGHDGVELLVDVDDANLNLDAGCLDLSGIGLQRIAPTPSILEQTANEPFDAPRCFTAGGPPRQAALPLGSTRRSSQTPAAAPRWSH
jgi:hypothetical protein